jgi:hypothetical protein
MNPELVRRLRTLEQKYAKELEGSRDIQVTWAKANSKSGHGLWLVSEPQPEESPQPPSLIGPPSPVAAESTENNVWEGAEKEEK